MEEECSEAALSMHPSSAVLAAAPSPILKLLGWKKKKQLVNEEETKVENIWSN